jgi:outer membrane protein assembly factor BamB
MNQGRSFFTLLLGSVLLTGCSLFGATEDDPQPAVLFQFDEQVALKSVWSAKVGSANRAYWGSLQAANSSDSLFFSDHSGVVVSLDLQTGKRLWAVDLDTSISGGVGYGSGLVLLGTIEGQVYALNAENGSTLWSATVSSEVLSSPAANGEIVAVHSIDNKLHVLDAKTGKELWHHDAGAPILSVRGTGGAVILDSMLIATFDSGKLIAFNPQNGALLWETRLALPKGRTELERMIDIDSRPLLVGDIVYSVSYQGRMGALTRGTGRNLWFQDSSSHHSPAYSDGKLYVTESDDTVRAVQAGSGQVIWSNDQLVLRELTGPIKFADHIAVADAQGYVHLLDADNGNFVGRTKVDSSGISAPLLVIDNILVIHANDGSVSAYKIQ